MALPFAVVTDSLPEVPLDGTAKVIPVDVTEVGTAAKITLNSGSSFDGVGSKFVPVTDTDVAEMPIVGVKLVIVGVPFDAVMVKGVEGVTDPAGLVTVIVPVVAPEGTVVTIWFAVADVIVAAVPLKLTVSWLRVVLKAVPEIVTTVPTGPVFGVN
jgi:hypothetical protein